MVSRKPTDYRIFEIVSCIVYLREPYRASLHLGCIIMTLQII
jgi:hypothetical protein